VIKTNNVKIKPWAIMASKCLKVSKGVSRYIKVDKGGEGGGGNRCDSKCAWSKNLTREWFPLSARKWERAGDEMALRVGTILLIHCALHNFQWEFH
jgi:hypothetical protein